jgi:glycosyltransferase involved in cell wall biosynthesis
MNIKPYKAKLEGKTFIFRIGSYNNLGGAETKAITMAEILKDKIGAKVLFLANGGDGILKQVLTDKGFETLVFKYDLKAKPFKKVLNIVRQILFLRKLKPDFILPWSSDNCKSILPFWKYTGAKYAWWNMQDEGRGLYKTPNEKKLLVEASEIISNSLAGQIFITETYGIPKAQIKLYNNPTELPDMSTVKPMWRKRLGIAKDTLVVSMMANITRYKDHNTLFRAWKLVVDHFKNKDIKVKLLLAGDCRETTQELKVIGFDLNISDSVVFLGSILEVNALILESDLVVHSSNHEGCPNAICEAMALEKPAVGTDIPGVREALSDKFENYTLSKPNNEKDLADKLIYMLEHPKLASEIAKFNKRRIETEYTLQGMVDTLLPPFVKAVR